MNCSVPPIRIRLANQAPVRSEADYVLYWMTSFRRPYRNFSLERAANWAQHLGKPLLIFEPLRWDYPWACPRFHQFVVDGMRDHQRHFSSRAVHYLPYVEPGPGAARGLLEQLTSRACLVVSDDFPCFFLPRMQQAVAARLTISLELVDSNGLLPLRAAPKAYERAVDFRRFLQKNLTVHLQSPPRFDPLDGLQLPRMENPPALVGHPLDQGLEGLGLTGPSPTAERGGFLAGADVLRRFLQEGLPRYAQQRSQPSLSVASGLSPYLHFGQVSAHQVLTALMRGQDWQPCDISPRPGGSKDGMWGTDVNREGFLDELVTWRELGYVFCNQRPDYDRYESLPGWARATLEAHLADARPHLYELDQLDRGHTHDPLWNAAQRQLREEGRIHNYLRMLWGKKVLEWSSTPQEALQVLIELNNRYALDGRNPNSYSGIFWCLGRFDRPWFERPIFGSVRYMSSDSAARKFKLDGYLARWGCS